MTFQMNLASDANRAWRSAMFYGKHANGTLMALAKVATMQSFVSSSLTFTSLIFINPFLVVSIL